MVYLTCFVSLLIGLLLGFRSLFEVILIQGNSMYPTLKPGDQILVIKYFPKFSLNRGQIVVVERPANPSAKESSRVLFIKRIVGVEGDIISIPTIDLLQLKSIADDLIIPENEIHTWHVGVDEYFLKGDNIGADSTVWGTVPLKSIHALMIAKLL